MNITVTKIIIALLAILAVTGFVAVPAPTEAASGSCSDKSCYETLVVLPTADPKNDFDKVDTRNPVSYLNTLYQIFISLAVVMAAFMIVLGGFETLSTDSIYGKEEGKKKIKRAIIGMLIIISSYLIVKAINPELLNFGALFENTESLNPSTTPTN